MNDRPKIISFPSGEKTLHKRTISSGGFQAELFVEPRLQAVVVHYIVMRLGTAEVVAWGQEESEAAAVRAAQDVMDDLQGREGRAAAR